MNKKFLGFVLVLPLTLSACATAPRSIYLGAAIGGAVGGGVGQAASHNSAGTAIGALIGAGLGSLFGYAAYNDKNKKASATGKAIPVEDLMPSLTKPRIRSYIVPDTIEGNKYIKSHRVFILENPGSWSKD
jgi:hypothetical protein